MMLLRIAELSRVARPQDASKAPHLVSLLSSSARSCLDAYKQRMLRPASEVADMEPPLGLAGRHVDPVFQHSFVRDLVEAGSVGLLKMLLNTLVCFPLPRRLELNGH